MAPYFLIFSSLLLLSLIQLDKKIRGTYTFIIFILVLMIIVLGLRYGIGNDYFSYERIFYGVEDISLLGLFIYNLSESTPIESGYASIILITKLFSDSYILFVFIWAILSISAKYYTFKKLSPFIGLSFLIYFTDEWFWKDLSGSRVGIASVFILLSVVYAYKRSFLKFLGIIFLASLFHSSAIVGLGIYFLRYFSNPKFMAISLVGAIIIATYGGMGIFLADSLSYMFGIESTSRLLKYQDSKYVDGIKAFGGTFMLHIMLSVLFIYYHKLLVAKWHYNSILVPMYVFGTVLMFLFIDYGIISGRIREMLAVPALVVVLPSLVLLFKGKQKLFGFALVVAYSALWFYLMMKDREEYQSILQFIF
ncbi:EpsG family protein [Aliarcobacter skirrowii]|uniref:EpsG family protein n=1 Tax=Aliarcobacter skirrowii TaxID=28200 RepID=UPI00082715E7|nr:EpsG family protein [Aliarcobacter skirrowii]